MSILAADGTGPNLPRCRDKLSILSQDEASLLFLETFSQFCIGLGIAERGEATAEQEQIAIKHSGCVCSKLDGYGSTVPRTQGFTGL